MWNMQGRETYKLDMFNIEIWLEEVLPLEKLFAYLRRITYQAQLRMTTNISIQIPAPTGKLIRKLPSKSDSAHVVPSTHPIPNGHALLTLEHDCTFLAPTT
jgi:hypothetical protein